MTYLGAINTALAVLTELRLCFTYRRGGEEERNTCEDFLYFIGSVQVILGLVDFP